jgi:DNA-binding NtrC family response regulator
MRLAQVLIYESDGKIADGLRDFAEERGIRLRELRQEKACLSELRRTGAGLLILKVGRDLEREMTLLERVAVLFPDTAVVVVGDTDYPGLSALAWDLGGHFVLFRQQAIDMLRDIVAHLLPARSETAEP